MKAIIYAAGLGTRLKPWTDKHPKALAIVNGKTLLQRNIEYLQLHGFRDVVVNVHHFADQVKQAIEDNDGWGSKVVISDESDGLLETGGGLIKAAPLLQGEDFFLSVNADILTNLDINVLMKKFKESNALISFAVSDRATSRKILLDETNQMCGWRNSSTGEEKIVRPSVTKNAMAYSCVTLYSSKVFDLITSTGKFSIMDEFLKLAANHTVTGVPHQGDKWIDVGTTENLAKAEAMFL